jgi:radical SAM protein with 4Fe4S-binding SPASM domain
MSLKELALKMQNRIFSPSRPPSPVFPSGAGSPAPDSPLSPEQIRLARSYLEGKDELEIGPKYLVLELTNICNLSCIMCPRRQMTRETGFMDFDLFRKIIEEAAPGVEMVYLHFMGESLLHGKIQECIDFASGRGMTVAMATNATLLTDERIDGLLRSRLDALLVSFDGGSPAVLERIRRGADFSSVRGQVLRLLQKSERCTPDFNPVIQFIRMPENEGDLDRFLALWKAFPQARVKIKDLHDFGNQLDDLKRMKHGDGEITIPFDRVCYEPWRGLVIGWDGRAVPCCNDYDGKTVLGNLRQQSLAAIWNGERMRQFRTSHKRGERGRLALCRKCLPPSASDREALQIFSPFSPSLYELQSYWNRGLQRLDPAPGESAYLLSEKSEIFVQDRTGEIVLAFEFAGSGPQPLTLDMFLYERLLARTTIRKGEKRQIALKTPHEFRGRLLRLQIQTRTGTAGKNPSHDPRILLRSIRNW